MRVNLSAVQSNGFFNITHAGQNKSNKKESDETNSSSMLESLMDQKQNVTDMKNELIGKTLEKGGELENIKPQIDAYEEQLQAIDDQITQTMAEQTQKMTDKDGTDKPEEVTTQQEIVEKKNKDMLTLSGSMEQIKILANVKTKMENQANTWSSEIKKDGPHASEFNKQNLSDLKSSLSGLNQNMVSAITDTVHSSNEINDVIVVKENDVDADNAQKDEKPEGLQVLIDEANNENEETM